MLIAALATIVADWTINPIAERLFPTIRDARQPSVLALLPLAMLALATAHASKLRRRERAAVGVIVGAAFANTLDRWLHGPVTDWIPMIAGWRLDVADVLLLGAVAVLVQGALLPGRA